MNTKNKSIMFNFNRLKYFILLPLFAIIIFLNIKSRGFGLDMIVLTLMLVAFATKRQATFIKEWWLYILGFMVYEMFRGVADDIAKWLHLPLHITTILNVEKFVFLGHVPTVVLQHIFPPQSVPFVILAILFFFYTMFFWYWLGIGFILWLKDKSMFHKYFVSLLLVSFISAIIYSLMPTAPPWYAASKGVLPPLNRFLWSTVFPGNGISFVSVADQNYFAAFPSLHFAWPFLASIYLVRLFKKNTKFVYLSFIVPFMILIAIVYGAEHYILDAVAGASLVYICIWLVDKFYKRGHKAS